MADAKAMFAALAGRFLFTHSKVVSVEALSPRFRRIEVAGDELRKVSCTPGDKVQLYIPGEAVRTYTPVRWRGDRASLIGFVHGNGPGSSWVQRVSEGDPADFMGPQRSIDLGDEKRPLVVTGDETSVAVSLALTEAVPSREVHVVLEASDPTETQAVCEKLGLTRVSVIPRGQLTAFVDAVKPLIATGKVPVFTGCATSIQGLKKQLAAKGKTKAYWAPGKRGLD